MCYENAPYSVMEAMALGKPLVVSDYGGLPELVEDGKNGYVYDAAGGDPVEALSVCLKKMLALPEGEYRSMAQYSLAKAKELFDVTGYVDKIERYFAKLGRHGGSA